MIRIVQISDTHLAPGLDSAQQNWDGVVAHLRAEPADLVIHTGDISLDGAHDPDHLDHARRCLDQLPCPWRAVPGNHDLGDVPPTDHPVTEHRRAAYTQRFGPGFWTETIGGRRLVGIDIQTLLGDLPDSASRWDWLADALDGDMPVALFLHRPILPPDATATDAPTRYVADPARTRLLALLRRARVELVASGHVHQWHRHDVDEMRMVWAPSTWAVLPDRAQPVIGTKRVGLLEHRIADTITSELVTPEDIVDQTIGVDFPSPYAH